MQAAVFGATGKAVALVLQGLIGREWARWALVRRKARIAEAAGLTAREGDARPSASATGAVTGADAVFCCQGMADVTQPATGFPDSVKTILDAMQACGERRILAIASAGVLDDPSGGYRNQEGLAEYLKDVPYAGLAAAMVELVDRPERCGKRVGIVSIR